jgi:hypothetical protein
VWKWGGFDTHDQECRLRCLCAQKERKMSKALKEFLPTADRMANMVKVGRVAGNKHAALTPGRNNLVQMQRKNCLIDEGTNELMLLNEEEIFEIYGIMITVMPTIAHGEAFLTVKNHTDTTLSLPGGQLQVEIIPSLSLPVCRASSKEY